jgi:hypothetical protein
LNVEPISTTVLVALAQCGLRRRICTSQNSKRRFFLAGLMGCLLALAGCDWFSDESDEAKKPAPARPYAYFLFDFEAEVEGETFAFTSKVACRRLRRHYILIPKSFGMKLASDKGFYVSAPDLCRSNLFNQAAGEPVWGGLEKNMSIVTIMYVTRSFEDPWEIRAFIHPLGPPPGAMVRLIKATVSPLTPDEAESYEVVPPGVNDPLAYFDENGRWGRKNKDWPQFGRHFVKIGKTAIAPDEIERTETEGDVQYIYLKDGVSGVSKVRDQVSFLTGTLSSSAPPPSTVIQKIFRMYQPTKQAPTDARREEVYGELNQIYSVRIEEKETCTEIITAGPKDRGQLFFYKNSLILERRKPLKLCPDKIVAFGATINKPIRMPIDFATQKFFRIGSDFYFLKISHFTK